MNERKMKSIIVYNGDTQGLLALYLGISETTLSKKIRDAGSEFTQTEIRLIKDRYHLSADEVDEIFFNQIVS